MKKLWEMLEKKGKIATIIGFVLSLPVNAKFVYLFFTNQIFKEDFLKAVIVVNIVAMVWFILPSKISLKSEKLTIEIED
ncbi:MAG: hypothetical protein GY928_33590 [Colwellia sp.]|nr:hypothetical protein [Colwellia sp.]